jgi:hypothetical protein
MDDVQEQHTQFGEDVVDPFRASVDGGGAAAGGGTASFFPQAGRMPAAKTVTKRLMKCWVRVVFMPVFSRRHQEQTARARQLPVVRILNPAAHNSALNRLGIRALFPGQHSRQRFNGDLIRRFPSSAHSPLVVAKLQRSDKPPAGVG